ncbi:MAG: hypothetical protein JO283_12895, partial [Bradyrhizobium sp.]|nr:hypothetical protein [Bradyrhizobium sp.]
MIELIARWTRAREQKNEADAKDSQRVTGSLLWKTAENIRGLVVIHGDTLPLPLRPANADSPAKVVHDRAQVLDQRLLLGQDQSDQALVIGLAAAWRARASAPRAARLAFAGTTGERRIRGEGIPASEPVQKNVPTVPIAPR